MNNSDFQAKYELAILKTAIGIHIIFEAGSVLEYDASMIDDSIWMLCNILADNVEVGRQTVYDDAHYTYQRLPVSYIEELQDSGIIQQLLNELITANIIKRLDN